MSIGPDELRSLGEALALVLVGLTTAYSRLASKRASSAARNASEAREQLANDHTTNLRDDLDIVLATAQRAELAAEAVRRDVGELAATTAVEFADVRKRSAHAHDALWRGIHGDDSIHPITGPIPTIPGEDPTP